MQKINTENVLWGRMNFLFASTEPNPTPPKGEVKFFQQQCWESAIKSNNNKNNYKFSINHLTRFLENKSLIKIRIK